MSSSGTDLSSSLETTNSVQEENLLLPRDRGTKKTDESTKDDDNDDNDYDDDKNNDVEAFVTTKKTDKAPPPATTTATDGKNKSRFRFFLLCLMVCQNSATVLVGRYLRSAIPREEQFVVNHFVCIAEITKVRTISVCLSLSLSLAVQLLNMIYVRARLCVCVCGLSMSC